MFAEVIQGKVSDPEAVKAATDRWVNEIPPKLRADMDEMNKISTGEPELVDLGSRSSSRHSGARGISGCARR